MSGFVPAKQSWLQLLSIQSVGVLSIPAIMIGQMINQKFGWESSLRCIAIGNFFLFCVGCAIAAMSTWNRQTTAEHAKRYFGSQGGGLFASLLIISRIGWFAIQLNIASISIAQLLEFFSHKTIATSFINLALGILMTGAMCFGMKTLKWISNISAPLLALTLLVTAFMRDNSLEPFSPILTEAGGNWMAGISLVIGGCIMAVIDLPSFFQHARSKMDALACVFLLYVIVIPCIEGTGVYLASVREGKNIFEMMGAGSSPLWTVWIYSFVLLSGWATNNKNFYSAIAASYMLKKKLSYVARALLLGALGTMITCCNPLCNLENVLDVIGIGIASIGAVIVVCYLFQKKNGHAIWTSLFGFIFGMASGLTSVLGLHLITGIAILDAFIAAAVMQILLNCIFKRKQAIENIYN